MHDYIFYVIEWLVCLQALFGVKLHFSYVQDVLHTTVLGEVASSD